MTLDRGIIISVFIPAGTFGSGTNRDKHNDRTSRELQTLRDGRTFVWYYGARLEVAPDLEPGSNAPAHLKACYHVTGRITRGPGC